MPQELLSPDQFLTRLTQTFSDPSSSGTIWLTHKRYTHEDEGDDEKMEVENVLGGEDVESREYEVLLRCTHGDHVKFSTRIPPKSLHTFQTHYSNLLKSSLAPHMRKRDKKREKARAERGLKRRKEVYTDVVLEGGGGGDGEGKRGKGHRQRQRKEAAQKKKEAEREKIEIREEKLGGVKVV